GGGAARGALGRRPHPDEVVKGAAWRVPLECPAYPAKSEVTMGRLGRLAASACVLVGIACAALAVRADERAAGDLPVEQVEKIVREYLMREPEIIYRALEELQRRQAAAEAERQRAAIVETRGARLTDPASPDGGNPAGAVTLVEFFECRCAYGRRGVPSLRELLDEDRDLRVVFKDLPVLGPDSV